MGAERHLGWLINVLRKQLKVNVLCFNEQSHVLLLVFKRTIEKSLCERKSFVSRGPFRFETVRESKAQRFRPSRLAAGALGRGGAGAAGAWLAVSRRDGSSAFFRHAPLLGKVIDSVVLSVKIS